ncbi:MAG: hypothetical protein JO219_01940 [Candidatus Eremiobacteraeota bacterium]|nr:hypothetical protein [Candidatus Eremiobacteraeota bacterium]
MNWIRPAARVIALAATALWLLAATPSPAPAVKPDPGAVAAVNAYVGALSHHDFHAAYALLDPAQQSYFGNVQNFASNTLSTQYTIQKFSLISALPHQNVVEFTVRETVSFLDVNTKSKVNAVVKEPFFALRANDTWRVKQLYQPWKSYAPEVSGSAQGITVTVHRVQFYDKRIQVDCSVANTSPNPVQVLPLGKSVLDDGAAKIPALNSADFPLNDVRFFEGLRLLPRQDASGYINFPVTQKKDEDQTFTLTVAPAIFDGAEQTFPIVVGPIHLNKL